MIAPVRAVSVTSMPLPLESPVTAIAPPTIVTGSRYPKLVCVTAPVPSAASPIVIELKPLASLSSSVLVNCSPESVAPTPRWIAVLAVSGSIVRAPLESTEPAVRAILSVVNVIAPVADAPPIVFPAASDVMPADVPLPVPVMEIAAGPVEITSPPAPSLPSRTPSELPVPPVPVTAIDPLADWMLAPFVRLTP